MDNLDLKIITATASQATIECPHCHEPGQTFLAPIGAVTTRVAGTCPKCDGVFIIRIVDDDTLERVRKNIAESIRDIMVEANNDKIMGLTRARHQIPEMLQCVPGREILNQEPEFDIQRSDHGLVILAKNSSASNILDLMDRVIVPSEVKDMKLEGI